MKMLNIGILEYCQHLITSDAYRAPRPPKTFEKGALIPQTLENLKFYFAFCHPYLTSESDFSMEIC